MNCVLSLSACSVSMVATLRSDQQVDVFFTGSIKPKVASLLNDLSSSNQKSTGALISAAEITASFQKVPELALVATKDVAPQGLEGRFRIVDSEKLSQRFLFVQQILVKEESRFSVTLNRESTSQLLSLFTPEIRDYLDALMAPIITGEKLSPADYLTLVTSVYGKTIAQEIASSQITLEVHVPGTICSVLGGSGSGSKAFFVIPFVDLLVLENPLVYQIAWKP
ncbi:hypothetical protein [Gracilinema caldarium]|nr:hypothetical protein [Gracilinema caldarium]